MRLILPIILVLAGFGCASCDRTTVIFPPTAPSGTTTETTQVVQAPQPVNSRIEFRVTGNPSSARVRYSTPTDGLIQVVTTLPFFTSFNTTADNLFVSLEVTPISYSVFQFPFLSAQIIANGNLFREVTSNEFLLNTISVNGTWRK